MNISKTDLERMYYIEALLLLVGDFGRPTLVERYGISREKATKLIKAYEECCPGQMILDKKPVKPLYVKSETCKPCLFESLDEAKKYIKADRVIVDVAHNNPDV